MTGEPHRDALRYAAPALAQLQQIDRGCLLVAAGGFFVPLPVAVADAGYETRPEIANSDGLARIDGCDRARCRRVLFCLLGPDDVREHALSVAQLEHEQLRSPAVRAANQLSELITVELTAGRGGTLIRGLSDGGGAVEMLVDRIQLLIIVLVGMLVGRIVRADTARTAIGIVRVIHAGAEIRVVERFILMIEPEVVADLLTHD